MTRKQLTPPEPKPDQKRLTKEEMCEAIVERWGVWLEDARPGFEHGLELEFRSWLERHNDLVYSALERAIFRFLERHKEEVISSILAGATASLTPPGDFWKGLRRFMATGAEPPEPAPTRPARSEPALPEDP
jgi:hypothetical protein